MDESFQDYSRIHDFEADFPYLQFIWNQLTIQTWNTVKTLYNVTRYNRIFNILHKIAGNRSVSIKIPSL